VPAVRGLSFDVRAGEVLALVGESGAGKSLTARAVLGLARDGARVEGSVRFGGRELAGDAAGYRELWGRRLAYVPQDALTVLSPVHTVGDQLAAAVRSVRGTGRREARRRAVAALEMMGIPDAERRARAYPHEFSGGMRQRAVIAMAMVNEPQLIVADEPTTALDPVVQSRVLAALTSVRERTGAALLLVSHDLRAVARHAHRVLVMYAGRAAEHGRVERVFGTPRAPYTAGLLASLQAGDQPAGRGGRLPSVPGAPPQPHALPDGCAFAPRCPLAAEECREREPEPTAAGDPHHLSACLRTDALPDPATGLFARGPVLGGLSTGGTP
jgi:peptide/nickel transport system ATP-binding protein